MRPLQGLDPTGRGPPGANEVARLVKGRGAVGERRVELEIVLSAIPPDQPDGEQLGTGGARVLGVQIDVVLHLIHEIAGKGSPCCASRTRTIGGTSDGSGEGSSPRARRYFNCLSSRK